MSLIKSKSIYSIYRQLLRHYGPQHWWPAKTRWEMMVGAILTQNTSWQNVERAILNLKGHNSLSIQKMKQLSTNTLAKQIQSSGFFNVKAKRIKSLLHYFVSQHDGKLTSFFNHRDLRDLRSALLSIHGIGKETADSILLYAGDQSIFVIDAYTRRIFKRYGLIDGLEDYDTLQSFIEKSIPRKFELYNEYHALLVKHAKVYCRAKPLCEACPLRTGCRKRI